MIEISLNALLVRCSASARWLALLLVCVTGVGATLAQTTSNPIVQVVLSQPTAQKGDTVLADITILNAVSIGGADIGITTDDTCLKIVDRQPGTFLPTTAELGGFSPFAELTDHATRFAASVSDRSKIATGTGVFYRVGLEVTCDKGIGEIKVPFVKLSGVIDVASANPQLQAYSLDIGNVSAVGAKLAIGPKGQVEAIPTEVLPTIVAPPELTPVTAPVLNPPQTPILWVAAICPLVIAIIGFFALFAYSRRRKRNR